MAGSMVCLAQWHWSWLFPNGSPESVDQAASLAGWLENRTIGGHRPATNRDKCRKSSIFDLQPDAACLSALQAGARTVADSPVRGEALCRFHNISKMDAEQAAKASSYGHIGLHCAHDASLGLPLSRIRTLRGMDPGRIQTVHRGTF